MGLADEVTENTEDFGYEGNLNIKFGEGVTEAIEMELKPIDISAKINSKGGNSSVDVSVKYDSQTLATLNGLYEGATGMMYARIPELNDAYIAGTEAQLEELINSYTETTTVTLTDLCLDLGVLQGGIKVETKTEWDGEEPTTTVFDFMSNSTIFKDDYSLNVNIDGKDYVTLTFTGEEFEPVDVVFPTENVYSFADTEELMEYAMGCDLEGFTENAKNVLGEDLYALIEEVFSAGDDYEVWEEDSLPDDSEPEDEESSVAEESSSQAGSDKDSSAVSTKGNTTNGSDKSANTGTAAGLAVITLGLAGVAVMISKRK